MGGLGYMLFLFLVLLWVRVRLFLLDICKYSYFLFLWGLILGSIFFFFIVCRMFKFFI